MPPVDWQCLTVEERYECCGRVRSWLEQPDRAAAGQIVDDLRNLVVATAGNTAIYLRQVAEVEFAPKFKRGDAGYMGKPAVVVSVEKQPSIDTVVLTREIEQSLQETAGSLPPGMKADQILFRQANFIETSVHNLQMVLLEAVIVVAVVLFAFLLNWRTTAISLTAIPVSILATAAIFHLAGLSINTMTLGGLAIAIGELVDPAGGGVGRQSGQCRNFLLGRAGVRVSLEDAVQDAMFDDRAMGRARLQQFLWQAIHLRIALVANHQAFLRVEHAQALAHVVQCHIEALILNAEFFIALPAHLVFHDRRRCERREHDHQCGTGDRNHHQRVVEWARRHEGRRIRHNGHRTHRGEMQTANRQGEQARCDPRCAPAPHRQGSFPTVRGPRRR